MIFSPLEQFNMIKLVSLNMYSLDLSMSSISIYSTFSMALIFSFFWFMKEKCYTIFRPWIYLVNSLFNLMLGLMLDNMGSKGLKFFNLIMSVFILVLSLNFLSLMPYSFTLTAHLGVCLTLSISIWLGATILGFYLNGLNFVSMFLPRSTPNVLMLPFVLIESLGYMISPLSLGMSLVANLAAGHLLLALGSTFMYFLFSNNMLFLKLTGVLPLLLLMVFSYLEFAVSFMQAYVFSLLSISYINDSMNLH